MALVMAIGLAVGDWACGATVEGFTEPFRTVNVAAAEGGLLTRILAEPGQRVEVGQVLATLDDDVLRASLDVARARASSSGAVEAAAAELDLASQKVDKIRELRANGHASAHELERAETDLAVATGRLHLAQNDQQIFSLECRKIEVQIERRRIRSPVRGVVTDLHKQPGEAVLVSDPAILALVELDPLRARFNVAYSQSVALAANQAVQITFADTGQKVAGRVECVSAVVDAKSGTVEVTVLIDNPDGRHPSGMRCTMEIPARP